LGTQPKSCHGMTGFNSSLCFDTARNARAANLCEDSGAKCEENNTREDPERAECGSAGAMPLRRRAGRNRFSRTLGLARSFGGEPTCSWRCLRDVCWQLAKPLSFHARKVECHPIRRCGRGDDTQLLRSMRHPGCLRAISFASYGERSASLVQNTHRSTGPISYRDR
jgi:hypothetical protein